MDKKRFNLLIAATGSVAALKIPILTNAILELNDATSKYFFEVRLIVTEHAKHFFTTSDLHPDVLVDDESSEWLAWKQKGDPVLHVELGKWADMLIIAPLDANTLAKMAQGICDNLITSTVRAWDMSKPVLFCPAMNTRMWDHPITSTHIARLKEWGYIEVPPIFKKLVCGDTGTGAMAEVETIVQKIKGIFDGRAMLPAK